MSEQYDDKAPQTTGVNEHEKNLGSSSSSDHDKAPTQPSEKRQRTSSEDAYYDDNHNQSTASGDDLFHLKDHVLDKKMSLVNDAMNKIGFTPYHWKLFCLNGMGYGTDSLLFLLQSVTQTQISAEFLWADDYNAIVSSNYVGLFFGALFWGFSSDIIGRRIAFHTTLFMTAIFGMAAAGGLNFVAVCSLSSICYFAAGGNLVLDSVTFLEFLPSDRQWMLSFMALWWGLGQSITCAFAWPLIVNFNCGEARANQAEWDANPCLRSQNMGWRYTYIACGAFVMCCALLRFFVIRMVESPKYELTMGRDDVVIQILDKLAESGKTVNPLTYEDLAALGPLEHDNANKKFLDKINPKFALKSLGMHLKGLYGSKKAGWNTTLNFLSWALIGLGYPLYMAFLPVYLQTRGAAAGDDSLDTTYRDTLVTSVCAIFGPAVAGCVCDIPKFGRRGTMILGSLATMALMFGYTKVSNSAGNLGFNCAINFSLNFYYGTLFAFTPETLESGHRATGNGIAVAIARGLGAIAPVIGHFSGTATAVPIYVMAALFGVLAIVSACMPFEPRGRHSM